MTDKIGSLPRFYTCVACGENRGCHCGRVGREPSWTTCADPCVRWGLRLAGHAWLEVGGGVLLLQGHSMHCVGCDLVLVATLLGLSVSEWNTDATQEGQQIVIGCLG